MRNWPGAAPKQAPPRGIVHCWRISLEFAEDSFDLFEQTLAPKEREEARRFAHEADYRRHVLGRGGLRMVLANALGKLPREIALNSAPHGKPSLEGGDLEFSVAHSGAIVLIAVTVGVPVGVDVEQIRPRPDWRGIARRFFHADEVGDIEASNDADAMSAFYRCWTRKEAIGKALGLGLSFPLDRYRVSCRQDDKARLIIFPGEPPASFWTIADLDPADGYAAALALPAPIDGIKTYTLKCDLL